MNSNDDSSSMPVVATIEKLLLDAANDRCTMDGTAVLPEEL